MSFTTDNLVQDGTFDVILSSDPALDVTKEEYAAYATTLNEGLLKLKDGQQPTRWTLRKKLSYQHKQWVDAAKVRVDRKGDMSVTIFEFMTREVRASLVGIKSPESVPVEKRLESKMKKTGDDLISEEFAVALGDLINEIFSIRNVYLDAEMEGRASQKKE
jgi:hypothetical protein